ncbi:hypothetical protein NDU88_003381 [Pleurodeles waltl]|uniref:Reverse transcriptase n=1 Tax=Pleurodeles waltl TaxID=8319 RepID=A0AAV7UDW0_PLEWA|nr:hypothetical protein NDU88_003381 [Pleurodeles waltl]
MDCGIGRRRKLNTTLLTPGCGYFTGDRVATLSCVDNDDDELEKTCIEFGKASGAKINSAKSKTLLLGHWSPTRDPLPFPIKQDFLKILGVLFGGEGTAEKSWEERLAKTKQKLGLWSLRKLTIEGKSLVCGRDPTSAPVRRTSVASAASNSQGHHENDLLFHLEFQDG